MLNKIPTIQELLEEKQQLLEKMWRHKPQEATHIYLVSVNQKSKFLTTWETMQEDLNSLLTHEGGGIEFAPSRHEIQLYMEFHGRCVIAAKLLTITIEEVTVGYSESAKPG